MVLLLRRAADVDITAVIKQISGNEFVFQQDSASAHHARETVELLRRETSYFISPEQWPPNGPDLNPVDYMTSGVCESKHACMRSGGSQFEHML